MKLLAVNGSPRKTWNTAQLLEKITEGACAAGAETELVHLSDLTYRGCISCLHCKVPDSKSYGRCILRDELTPLLDKAHEADVLVLGSPFYFSMETGKMRSFMERLWFQYYLYTKKKPPMSPRKKATALVYTMNAPQEMMEPFGKNVVVNRSKSLMETLFAPCEVFCSCDTKQVKDYSRYEMDYFDVPAKLKRHEEVFPKELQAAFELGKKLVQ